MDFIAYTIKVTISCYLEVNKIQIQIIILDVGPHKNEKNVKKKKKIRSQTHLSDISGAWFSERRFTPEINLQTGD